MAKTFDKVNPSNISLDPGSFQPPSGYKPGSGHRESQKSFTSTRVAHHRGHTIKVKTTYRIEIDDEPVTVHTVVLDDGTVHCHGLPNYSFSSAVDMAKAIVDAARLVHYQHDDLGGGDQNDGHGAGGHDHHASGHHGSHDATHGGDQ